MALFKTTFNNCFIKRNFIFLFFFFFVFHLLPLQSFIFFLLKKLIGFISSQSFLFPSIFKVGIFILLLLINFPFFIFIFLAFSFFLDFIIYLFKCNHETDPDIEDSNYDKAKAQLVLNLFICNKISKNEHMK